MSLYESTLHASVGHLLSIFQDFVWNYVIIDDRIPVFGFNEKKAGKPYFARCRSADELWFVKLNCIDPEPTLTPGFH